MEKQYETIKGFCGEAQYYLVRYENKEEEELGKIIIDKELPKIDLSNREIYRSIEYKDGNTLLVYNLKSYEPSRTDNPLELLLKNLEGARIIETVYPDIFSWIFDGISIKAYAIVPSGNLIANSTLSRYGGTEQFIKILRQHLENIRNMSKGITPDYNFLKNDNIIDETELSLGSVNLLNNMYSIGISLKLDYINILENSKNNLSIDTPINVLDIKYWAKEINPDFIHEAKHIKLNNTLSLDKGFALYPPCIKTLTGLKTKGNYNRFVLARFLLSIHNGKDAKFAYTSVMGIEELDHIQNGACKGQWNFIHNNMKRYSCPTCRTMKGFCDPNCKLSHPLEEIQKYLESD